MLWVAWQAGAATPPVYTIATIAGSSSLGDGGPAIAAQIGAIQGIAVDLFGNIYLSDTDHARVRKINTAGIITTIAGTGVAGYGGDGGPAASAELNLPYGLAVDLAGDVYIADLGNNRVRRISPQGVIATLAGTGVAGSAGDGGPAVNAQLNAPRNLLVDGLGNCYISEFNGHRVRKVSAAGVVTTLAGTGVAGFRGDGGLAAAAELAYPAGLAMDTAGALYVADSGNQRVRKISNGVISTVLGGASATTLATPIAVAVDHTLTLYVADASDTVHSYSPAGVWKIVAGTGTVGFSGDGGPATLAALIMPRDLAFDLTGDLFLADGVRLREVNLQGVIETVAGDDYLHALGDNGPAQMAILLNPNAVALDQSGNLYIADAGTNRIRVVLPSGVIETYAGTGSPGYQGDGGTALAAELNDPLGVAAGATGVLIADSGNQRVRLVAAGASIATVAGSGTAGQGPAGLPAAKTNLDGPAGVCTDGGSNIYVADTLNNRVLRIPAGGVVAAAASAGFSAGYAGDGGPATQALLNQPSACAVDGAGNLFIADTGNHAIREVTTDGRIHTVAGTGTAGNSGDEGPATAAALNAPAGVAVDAYGDLYIADTGNNQLRLVTADGILHTIAGQGGAGFGGDGGSALAALLDVPAGLAVNSAGDVYFADRGNNRVRVLVPGTPVTLVSLAPSITVVSAASLSAGNVAPGELVTISGSGLGPASGVVGGLGANGSMVTSLGGVEVDFDGVPAPLLYVQASQINAQVPYTVAASAVTQIAVWYQGQVAGSALETVAQAAPGLFPVAVNQDGSINSVLSPAPAASVVTLYGTGEGLTNGPNQAGLPASAPYPQPLLPVTVTLGQTSLPLLYAGSAPAAVGLLQVNCVLPSSVAAGVYQVVLSVGSFLAPPVNLWVQ